VPPAPQVPAASRTFMSWPLLHAKGPHAGQGVLAPARFYRLFVESSFGGAGGVGFRHIAFRATGQLEASLHSSTPPPFRQRLPRRRGHRHPPADPSL
jgi:hypothetical protein